MMSPEAVALVLIVVLAATLASLVVGGVIPPR
jgi:hypothetical protein